MNFTLQFRSSPLRHLRESGGRCFFLCRIAPFRFSGRFFAGFARHARQSRAHATAAAGRRAKEPADGTLRAMPPPAGSIGAGDGAASMAFRRRSSAASNNTAEQARAALVRAFEDADLDHSGMVNKEELAVVIRDQLHIQLQDPVNDLDIIFGLATHTCVHTTPCGTPRVVRGAKGVAKQRGGGRAGAACACGVCVRR